MSFRQFLWWLTFDAVLNSALGRYDGDVYTDLYERALKSPRNKSEVNALT